MGTAGMNDHNKLEQAKCLERFLAIFADEYAARFEFIGGRTSAKGRAYLRCKTCGAEFDKNGSFAQQHANIYCPVCHVYAFDKSNAPKDGRLLEHIAKLHRSGYTTDEIAAVYGLQAKHVLRLMKEQGLDTSSNREQLRHKRAKQKVSAEAGKAKADLKAWSKYVEALCAMVDLIGRPKHKDLTAYEPTVFVCKHCGERRLFFPSHEHYGRKKPPKYCSKRCSTRAARKRNRADARHRRRVRLYGTVEAKADKITLDAVIEKDNGTCYLCGTKTNKKDYTRVRGYFSAGSTYPTVDHVIALANGGTHTWDNVRLACRDCNSRKGTT